MIRPLLSRKHLIALVLLSSLILSACNSPQTASKMLTIGIINYVESLSPEIDGLKAGMTGLGYVEGKTVTYIYHGVLKPDNDILDSEVQDLLKQGATLFMAMGTPPTERVKKALEGTNYAGIFAPVVNPVELGLITDLRKPGGQLTGIDSGGPLLEKGMQWLLEAAPNVKRIHIPYRNADDNIKTEIPMLQAAATKLKVELVVEGYDTVDQAIAALSTYSKTTDASYVVPALLSDVGAWKQYMKTAADHGIPVGTSYGPIDFGPLASVQPDWFAVGKQVARLADQIAKGSEPGTIPVESADFVYALNLVTMNDLGLNVPDSVLSQAKIIYRGEETASK